LDNEKILVIDDSPEIIANLSEYLKAAGYDVDASTEGGNAIDDRRDYDIVVCGLRMPEWTGWGRDT
jgi:CheY-like chemotaxis protein